MKTLKILKSRLTMVRQQTLFWDKVNGQAVNLYKDCFGEKWMAQSRLGMRISKG
jgi:hypothetical protein